MNNPPVPLRVVVVGGGLVRQRKWRWRWRTEGVVEVLVELDGELDEALEGLREDSVVLLHGVQPVHGHLDLVEHLLHHLLLTHTTGTHDEEKGGKRKRDM